MFPVPPLTLDSLPNEQHVGALKIPSIPSDEVMKFRLKHGYNQWDEETQSFIADFGARSRLTSKQSSQAATGA